MAQQKINVAKLIQDLYSARARKSYYKQAARMWMFATFALAVACVLLVAVVAFAGDDELAVAGEPLPYAQATAGPAIAATAEPIPASIDTGFEVSETSPAHILASVHMANNNHCSATVIGDDDHETALIVSAAHCVAGNIGNSCWFHLPTGEPFRAELVAFDKSIDISVFRVARADVLATTKIVSPAGWSTEAVVEAVGYPSGKGPNFKTIHYTGDGEINPERIHRWHYAVDSGEFFPGDSGGGVFYNGLLAGVISHKGGATLYAAPQPDVFRYVSEVAAEAIPGVPIAAQCPPGGCRPCPPRRRNNRNNNNWGDERAPSPPPFRPQPNIPIVPPKAEPPIRDRDRDRSIDEIKTRIDEIERKLSAGVDAGTINREINSIRQSITLLSQENGATLSRIEAIEQSNANKPPAANREEFAALLEMVETLKVKITAIEDNAAPNPPTVDEILGQLPAIPVRVVDENGNVIDSEKYKLGEPITLFGRYRSRKSK